MDLPGGNGLAPEFKIAGGAGIFNDDARVPEIKGRPGNNRFECQPELDLFS